MCSAKSSIVKKCNSDLLTTRKVFKVGYWNVRTMFQTGKTAQVCAEMKSYNLDILGLSECRWINQGKSYLQNEQLHVIYSGRNDGVHAEGVSIIMSPKAERSLIAWGPVSERIITARFQTKYFKLTVIQCYAPTNDDSDNTKDLFYDTLQEIVSKTPLHDIVFVMGDFNAKVGGDNTGVEKLIGTHGLGTTNQNGERLLELCGLTNFVIADTFFPHKNIHKITWISPDKKTKNQIDHFCVNRKYRSIVQDVRAHRGADVGSDHYLCIAKLKMKLKALNNNTGRERKIDSQRLTTNDVKSAYNIEIQNRYSASSNPQNCTRTEQDTEAQWSFFKDTVKSAASTTAGHVNKNKKSWISENTWAKIQERKQTKMNILSAKTEFSFTVNTKLYSILDKEVKSSARKDKQNFINGLATVAEAAAKKGNSKTLFHTMRQLCNKTYTTNIPIKDKSGKLLLQESDQKQRWAEHFTEILNRPQPTTTPNLQHEVAMSPLPVSCDNFTISELKQSIKKLRNNKAAGEDEITGEMLKSADDTTLQHLLQLFNKVWQNESPPQQWKNGMIIKLPKKGDLSDCNNWRGITLLSIPGKLFCSILIERLKRSVDERLREEQAGFRPHRSCIDHIVTLRTIIEESVEYQAPLLINFIDFQKAFDSLHRPSLWKILEIYGFPAKYVNIIKTFYTDSSCCIRTDSGNSDWFPVNTGVKQGCVMSPILFGIAIDWVMRKCVNDNHLGIPWSDNQILEDLDFADDIALLSTSHQDAQEKTDLLHHFSNQIGLQINTTKTKVMDFIHMNTGDIKLDNQNIEKVTSFTYLGSRVTLNGDTTAEIMTRIALAASAFNKLANIWKSKTLRNNTKLRLFNSCVIPVLTYGCESWKSTSALENKLNAFENKCLRRITNTSWKEFKTNKTLREETNQELVSTFIRRRRWKYIGHVLRMDNSRLPRQAFTWTPKGTRKRGRPRETLRRTVNREIKTINIRNMYDLPELAKDRRSWGHMITALCAAYGTRGL